MNTASTRTPTRRQPLAEVWARSGACPVWVAVALYAAANADAYGVAKLRAGQLREAVAPHATPDAVSRAIRRAVAAGWLAEGSSAWCLRLARPDTPTRSA